MFARLSNHCNASSLLCFLGPRGPLVLILMIHKAYMPVYSDPDFSCGRDGTNEPTEGSTRGPRGPKK